MTHLGALRPPCPAGCPANPQTTCAPGAGSHDETSGTFLERFPSERRNKQQLSPCADAREVGSPRTQPQGPWPARGAPPRTPPPTHTRRETEAPVCTLEAWLPPSSSPVGSAVPCRSAPPPPPRADVQGPHCPPRTLPASPASRQRGGLLPTTSPRPAHSPAPRIPAAQCPGDPGAPPDPGGCVTVMGRTLATATAGRWHQAGPGVRVCLDRTHLTSACPEVSEQRA